MDAEHDQHDPAPGFLARGGRLGRRIAAHDWTATPLGPIAGWPAVLRHAVSLMLSSPVPMALLWGARGTMLYNDGYAAFSGERDARLLGSDLLEGWEEAADFNANVLRVGLAGGTLSYRDHPITLARNGRAEQVWLDLDYSPVTGEDGAPAGVIAIVVETTATHNARAALHAGEARLHEREAYHRQLIDGAVDYGIVATDLGGTITLWNRGAEEMLGWTEDEVLGRSMGLFFTPEDRAAGRPATKRAEALASGRAHDARWHLRKCGGRFWGLSEMSPLRDAEGAPVGFVKLMRDRTAEHAAEAALQAKEDQLRRAQVAGGVGVFAVDIATGQVSGSPEFFHLYGLADAGPRPARELEALVAGADQGLASSDARRRAGVALLDVEYRIHRADTGEERIIARRADYERDADGRPVRLVGVVQDATERRAILAQLQRREAQFSALAQNMPAQVWTARADGTFDWFNDQVTAFVGRPVGPADVRQWSQIVHPDERPGVVERWTAAVASGETYEAEFRVRRHDGAYRWHLARAVPLRDEGGAITAWIGTNTDIDAQKAAEAASAKDRDRLWNNSQDLMMVADMGGIITAVNPSAERLLGWREDEMVGQPLAKFVHPDDLAASVGEIARLADGHTTLAFENRYCTRAGGHRLLSWTAVPEQRRIHAIGRDITDQRAVEEALRQSQKMEAVGQLTGGIAHDFNNLLQGITGSLDIMEGRLRQGRSDDLPRWLAGAKGSANRAAALTHRLLAFSRRQPLDPRPVRANPLVQSMEDLLRRTLGERVELELALAGGLWLTRCDPNQLESAILNLAINARDAMEGGGRLTIETGNAHLDQAYAARERDVLPGQYVCISVTDTGTGMARDTIARAFEPFFTTKPIGQGTGLGLSMIYGFTRQSEGFARIYSEEGTGTTVRLYLPRYRGAEESEEPEATARDPAGTESGEVVLVVEDEAVVRGLIVEVLGELGYRAIEAADGPAGLEVLQSRRRIDLLVTDIGLPGLNGRQVADAGRTLRPGLKVLFMTGYAENAAMASGFLEPGMALITKPFAMDALAARIREIVAG